MNERKGQNMVYNFSERKEQRDQLETRLYRMKKEYQSHQMSEEQMDRLLSRIEEAKQAEQKERRRVLKIAAMAVALAGCFLILPNTSATVAHAMARIPVIGQLVEVVTFREYAYESDRNHAEIQVPEILPVQDPDSTISEQLDQTAEEINAEIQSITDDILQQFESHLEEEEGYQEVIVKSEILAATEDYFTLKLFCYQGAGSGYQWNYYYTIDLDTGERLQLKDLFAEDANYITPISENIKVQMETRMSEDDQAYFWLDDEIEEWNFRSITEETAFYLNEQGNVVIAFDEGEVAPMYMGVVEFEIPAEVLEDIRK